MTKILCDTDILSVFAKIDRLDLLEHAFPNAEMIIVEAVYDELEQKKDTASLRQPRERDRREIEL